MLALSLALVLIGHGKPIVPVWPDHLETITQMGCDITQVHGAEPKDVWWHTYLWLQFPDNQDMTLDGKPWGLVKLDEGKTIRRLGYGWTSGMTGNRWQMRIAINPGNEDLKGAKLCHDARKEAVLQILAARKPPPK